MSYRFLIYLIAVSELLTATATNYSCSPQIQLKTLFCLHARVEVCVFTFLMLVEAMFLLINVHETKHLFLLPLADSHTCSNSPLRGSLALFLLEFT